MADREKTLLAGRVTRIRQVLGRPMDDPWSSTPPRPPREHGYLRETGEEFYWNDLEWEKLTGEERVDEEFLTELAFPGFLAFARGLLLDEAPPDSPAPPRPAPAVAADLMGFMARRVVELEEEAGYSGGQEREHREAELKMTSRLVDLLIYMYYRLSPDEVAKVEAALVVH